ncbi:cytochrome P450 [Streptomyces sp. p1417]|uniref:Cytochrome P450 n=1 Tax=Streptomyces typhae TaxID=2681492 RepID=A0A6L6X2E1_9ACTN|nr:cytochrome P450 [Streptomyces typhae]MVO87789.1 cytochrome P450 [Streptomyces typhae]
MLDVFGDFSREDPAAALAEAAAACPFQEAAENGGLYAFRADDVRHILTSGEFWSQRSTDRRLAPLPEEDRRRRSSLKEFFAHWPVFSDSGYHKRIRSVSLSLLRGTVTPQLRATCTWVADERLAAVGEEPFDWLDEVARPLAWEVVAALTGRVGATVLIELSRSVMDELATPRLDMERIDRALASVDGLREWLRAARTAPPTPFVAGVAKLWDDPAFGPESATALLTQVVTGAHDPTVAALCVVGERITCDLLSSTFVPRLREEVFRLATPFRFASRYARGPVSVGPYRLEEGDRVNLCLAAANLDPGHYPDPLRIQNRGATSRSLSFGAGGHYCPGAPLARSVVEVLLEALKRAGAEFRADLVEREPELPTLRYRALRGRLVRPAPQVRGPLLAPAERPGQRPSPDRA